ncbi:hypothetical protein DNHGIG_09070 [Collibacillus ludicampi]|uniref:PDZ domain-containing protein n=1 Tax=Collibacillus ludicampi TaxID=2771369 RepID=A0AAV4LCH7_9BACL|nr:PDZ domain-containing protein [Collibacillus ludicampi]GIM45358.1 hypothetical protein DNHGIG_09070 [Collibacillus ludicampi]
MTITAYAWELLHGYVGNVGSPLFYVALLLVFFQYRRQNRLERQMFGLRVTSPLEQTVLSFIYGVVAGAIVTVLLSLLGVVLNPRDFTYIWTVALLLSLFNVRYICFAYAGGLLSLLSLLLHTLPPLSFTMPFIDAIYHDLLALQVPHVLSLVAVLHLIEAALVRLQGGERNTPVFVIGKRGRLVGGFALQKFWVLPMAAVVLTGTSTSLHPPPWWGILPLSVLSGLEIIPIPAVLGYSGVAVAHEPRTKAKRTSRAIGLYSVCLLLLVIGSSYAQGFIWLAAVFAPLAHEMLVLWDRADERNRTPLYVHPERGLRILEVLPDSPANEMGLRSGESIVKVNGMEVNTKYDMHVAIDRNPAFVKLEVADMRGEIRLVQKPLYEGERYALGVILVPDEESDHYVRIESIPLWRAIWKKRHETSV